MGMYRAIAAAAGALACVVVPSHTARSQEVKLTDLEGTTVTAETTLDQLVEQGGLRRSVKVTQVWKISVGANKAIDFTVDSTARGPGGTRKAKQSAGSYDLDEPRHVASLGGGEALWTFVDGALTFFRTFPSGGYRMNIAFAHALAGLTCTATGAFARENGTGRIRQLSLFSGDWVTILSARQVASTCKVSREAASGVARQ